MNRDMEEAWVAFVEMRRAKGRRAPFTLAAEKRIGFEIRRLQADGHDPAEVLWQSVINGWSGVFPVKGRQVVPVDKPKVYEPEARFLQTPEQHAATAQRLKELKAKLRMKV